MLRPFLVRTLIAAMLAVSFAATPAAFSFLGPRWADGAIVMELQLGPSSVLSDGCADWGCSAERALATWNLYLSRIEFRVNRNSGAVRENCSVFALCRNNVFFSDTIYGRDFGDTTLAVTTTRSISGAYFETDVIFNNAFSWNSYRGPIRRNPTVEDFYRTAIHEFGHAFGLDHPDEHGQNVASIMNAHVSDLDDLQIDDIRGAYALYTSSGGIPVNFPPRNETADFRNQLEGKYRDGLGRGANASFVDVEGSVVWIQEYVRYRLNRCSHNQATARTDLQIKGFGVQPACGSPAGPIAFPPRNEPAAYRNHLEDIYRDVLKRGTVQSFVDIEGDVVWIQEYLRYRLTGCSHVVATQKVFQQIDGGGVQVACNGAPQPPGPGPAPSPSGSMTGTWKGSAKDIGAFSFTLVQSGASISGSYFDDGFGAGKIDPAEPGMIDGAGNVVMRVKQANFTDFTFRGKLDASGRRVTGGIFGSGFSGEPFTMDKQ